MRLPQGEGGGVIAAIAYHQGVAAGGGEGLQPGGLALRGDAAGEVFEAESGGGGGDRRGGITGEDFQAEALGL
jgi:hypothetical protein